MTWRCANDPFGYCSGTPEWEQPPSKVKHGYSNPTIEPDALFGGSCKLDPKTCGKYITYSQRDAEIKAQQA